MEEGDRGPKSKHPPPGGGGTENVSVLVSIKLPRTSVRGLLKVQTQWIESILWQGRTSM